MAQLNVRLTDEQIERLRRYAAGRRTPVAWLMKDYIDYLLQGGNPVAPGPVPTLQGPDEEELSLGALAMLADRGRAFDWLADEPDLYSAADGEAV